MIIKERVVAQLEQFVKNQLEGSNGPGRPSSEPEYVVEIPSEGEGVGAAVSFSDFDRYSVTFSLIDVYVGLKLPDEAGEDYLRHAAAELCRRLTYLEEPLQLLELSPVDGVAQLRSNPPEQRPTERVYWEVTLQTSPKPRARLTRYRWGAGNGARKPLAYPATFSTLGRTC